MIEKLEGTSYGYKVLKSTTREEWDKFVKKFQMEHKIRCIICNRNMAKRFRIPLLGNNIMTINNQIMDDVFFLNHRF